MYGLSTTLISAGSGLLRLWFQHMWIPWRSIHIKLEACLASLMHYLVDETSTTASSYLEVSWIGSWASKLWVSSAATSLWYSSDLQVPQSNWKCTSSKPFTIVNHRESANLGFSRYRSAKFQIFVFRERSANYTCDTQIQIHGRLPSFKRSSLMNYYCKCGVPQGLLNAECVDRK